MLKAPEQVTRANRDADRDLAEGASAERSKHRRDLSPEGGAARRSAPASTGARRKTAKAVRALLELIRLTPRAAKPNFIASKTLLVSVLLNGVSPTALLISLNEFDDPTPNLSASWRVIRILQLSWAGIG